MGKERADEAGASALPDKWPNAYRVALGALRERGILCASARDLAQVVGEVLASANVPVHRIRLGIEVSHPTLMSIGWVWSVTDGFHEHLVPKETLVSPMYLRSPVRPVKERRASQVRIRPQEGDDGADYNLTQDLRRDEYTDYVA